MTEEGVRDGTALERALYWREQHRQRAIWLRSRPDPVEVLEWAKRYFDPEWHEQVAIPDYDLWIEALKAEKP